MHSFFFRAALLAIPVLGVTLVSSAAVFAPQPGVIPEAGDASELVSKAMAAIVDNHAHLPSLEAVFEARVTNPGQERPHKQVMRHPGGGTSHLSIEPEMVFTVQYTLRADDVRFESRGSITVRRDGRETGYFPETRQAVIRAVDSAPGFVQAFPPCDFRNLVFVTEPRTIVQVLKEDNVVAARLITTKQGRKLLHLIVESRKGKRNRSVHDLDTSRNFLPVVSADLYADGTIGELVHRKYRELIPGKWILEGLTTRCTSAGAAPGHDADWANVESRWGSVATLTLTQLTTDTSVSNETFTLTLPPGVYVQDHISGKSYVVGAGGSAGYTWYIIILLGFTLGLAAYIRLRLSRSKTA